MLVGSVPCALGYNLLKNIHIIGNRNILESEDFIVSNLLLPIGSLIYVLFCTTKFGWGAENYLEEANTGKGLRISRGTIGFFRFVLPVLIIIILVSGFL